jgi:hypothetical protein
MTMICWERLKENHQSDLLSEEEQAAFLDEPEKLAE